MQNEKELLSIGQAAEFLGVSIDTLRRWEKKGKITTHRSSGGHRYFRKEELQQLFGKRYKRFSKSGQIPVEKSQQTQTVKEEVVEKESIPEISGQEVNEVVEKHPIREEKEIRHYTKEKHLTPSSVIDGAGEEILKDQKPNKEVVEIAEKKASESTPTQTPLTHYPPIEDKPSQTPLRKRFSIPEILSEQDNDDTLTKLQKFIFGAFIAFLVIDIILLIVWQATTGLVSPMK